MTFPKLSKEDVDRMMRFYAVDTLAGLVAAQAYHVEKLLSKLPAPQAREPGRVREG